MKFTEIKSNVKLSSSASLATFEVLRRHMWLVTMELDSTDTEQCHHHTKSSWTVLVQGPSPPRRKSLGCTFLFLSQGIPFIPCLLCQDRGRALMYENILFWAPTVLLSKDEGYFFAKPLASPTATRHCLQSVHLPSSHPFSVKALCPWGSSLGLGNGEPNPPEKADHPATDLKFTLFAENDHFPRTMSFFPAPSLLLTTEHKEDEGSSGNPGPAELVWPAGSLATGPHGTPALTWPWTE